MSWKLGIRAVVSIASGIVIAASLILDIQGISQIMGHTFKWQWWVLGGFLAFVLVVGWTIVDLHRVNDRLQKKLNNPSLQKAQQEHLNRIRDLVSNWMGSLSIPRIGEVMPGTTPGTDNVKNDFRFAYLKEHLPSKELWRDFNAWETDIQEYLSKCKALRNKIQESWKVDGTEATGSLANPILKMMDVDKPDLNLLILYDKEHALTEVTNQILVVNGTEVVRGILWRYVKAYEELGHYRCLHETLGIEYQKLVNEFLNHTLVGELRPLYSSLTATSHDIQEYLQRILENTDYAKHHCKDCPMREETT